MHEYKEYIWRKLQVVAKPFFIAVLFIGAIVYISSILINNSDGLWRALERVSWWNICAAILIAIPMYYVKAIYHLYSLRRISHGNVPASAISAYLQSQIVRYLPGKIWGLIYQSQKMLSYAAPSQIVMANIFQMLMTNIMALGIVFALVAGELFDGVLFYLFIPLTICVVEINHRHSYIERNIIKLIVKIIPKVDAKLANNCAAIRWNASFLLLIEWFFYFAAFFALLWGGYSPSDIFSIAIWYSAASLISLLFIFIPAGIIVREALFVSVATFFSGDQADLLVIASLLRLVWVLSEICTAALSSAYNYRRVCE